MPRTLLTDELWSKLLVILLELGLYDKPNLRKTIEGILYRMRIGCPGATCLLLLASSRPFITALTAGQKGEFFRKSSKYCQRTQTGNG